MNSLNRMGFLLILMFSGSFDRLRLAECEFNFTIKRMKRDQNDRFYCTRHGRPPLPLVYCDTLSARPGLVPVACHAADARKHNHIINFI